MFDITCTFSTCYALDKQAYREIGNSGNENAKQKQSNHYVQIKPSLSGNYLLKKSFNKTTSVQIPQHNCSIGSKDS